MKKAKVKVSTFVIIVFVLLVVSALLWLMYYFNILPAKEYTAKDFDIPQIKSSVDFNGNGVDDYTDIMLGARKDAENKPKYDGKYWATGYPPDEMGVCTDVVWRAFKNAGYDLRSMVDNDIAENTDEYPNVSIPDSNIDFRRVANLDVFFKKYAQSLTTDMNDIENWQPGDIVVFRNDKHIGIVSDKRNSDGVAYIIHNAGQPKREEDYLKRDKVTAHYRFDASKIDKDILVKWE